jgi:hypothetical protein
MVVVRSEFSIVLSALAGLLRAVADLVDALSSTTMASHVYPVSVNFQGLAVASEKLDTAAHHAASVPASHSTAAKAATASDVAQVVVPCVFVSGSNYDRPNRTSRYHDKRSCGNLKCVSTGIVECSREAAERRSLRPCKVCASYPVS